MFFALASAFAAASLISLAAYGGLIVAPLQTTPPSIDLNVPITNGSSEDSMLALNDFDHIYSLVHITDSHITALKDKKYYYLNEALKTYSPQINPALIIHTGDMTEGKKNSIKYHPIKNEGANYLGLLKETNLWKSPFYIDLLGNHDLYGTPTLEKSNIWQYSQMSQIIKAKLLTGEKNKSNTNNTKNTDKEYTMKNYTIEKNIGDFGKIRVSMLDTTPSPAVDFPFVFYGWLRKKDVKALRQSMNSPLNLESLFFENGLQEDGDNQDNQNTSQNELSKLNTLHLLGMHYQLTQTASKESSKTPDSLVNLIKENDIKYVLSGHSHRKNLLTNKYSIADIELGALKYGHMRILIHDSSTDLTGFANFIIPYDKNKMEINSLQSKNTSNDISSDSVIYVPIIISPVHGAVSSTRRDINRRELGIKLMLFELHSNLNNYKQNISNNLNKEAIAQICFAYQKKPKKCIEEITIKGKYLGNKTAPEGSLNTNVGYPAWGFSSNYPEKILSIIREKKSKPIIMQTLLKVNYKQNETENNNKKTDSISTNYIYSATPIAINEKLLSTTWGKNFNPLKHGRKLLEKYENTTSDSLKQLNNYTIKKSALTDMLNENNVYSIYTSSNSAITVALPFLIAYNVPIILIALCFIGILIYQFFNRRFIRTRRFNWVKEFQSKPNLEIITNTLDPLNQELINHIYWPFFKDGIQEEIEIEIDNFDNSKALTDLNAPVSPNRSGPTINNLNEPTGKDNTSNSPSTADIILKSNSIYKDRKNDLDNINVTSMDLSISGAKRISSAIISPYAGVRSTVPISNEILTTNSISDSTPKNFTNSLSPSTLPGNNNVLLKNAISNEESNVISDKSEIDEVVTLYAVGTGNVNQLSEPDLFKEIFEKIDYIRKEDKKSFGYEDYNDESFFDNPLLNNNIENSTITQNNQIIISPSFNSASSFSQSSEKIISPINKNEDIENETNESDPEDLNAEINNNINDGLPKNLKNKRKYHCDVKCDFFLRNLHKKWIIIKYYLKHPKSGINKMSQGFFPEKRLYSIPDHLLLYTVIILIGPLCFGNFVFAENGNATCAVFSYGILCTGPNISGIAYINTGLQIALALVCILLLVLPLHCINSIVQAAINRKEEFDNISTNSYSKRSVIFSSSISWIQKICKILNEGKLYKNNFNFHNFLLLDRHNISSVSALNEISELPSKSEQKLLSNTLFKSKFGSNCFYKYACMEAIALSFCTFLVVSVQIIFFVLGPMAWHSSVVFLSFIFFPSLIYILCFTISAMFRWAYFTIPYMVPPKKGIN